MDSTAYLRGLARDLRRDGDAYEVKAAATIENIAQGIDAGRNLDDSIARLRGVARDMARDEGTPYQRRVAAAITHAANQLELGQMKAVMHAINARWEVAA